jgi:formate dehydrogenase iron-sulfur subunit
MSEQTPLESFINFKTDTGMQCGNYSIDLPELKDDEQYRFHFDATKCIGCRCCEVACNEQNNNPADIKWRRVGEMEGGEFGSVSTLFNSMSCNHCVDPACLIGCPTNSYIKFDNGIVFHDDPSCIGCSYCTWNCPYSVPTFHEERNIVTKCHMCHERLDVGQSPACVQACPSGAIEIEAVNTKEWLKEDIDTQGNIEGVVNARVTYSTTRYTLPENLSDELIAMDDHHLNPAHSEWPLVFMTVLTQISLGAFFALFLGELIFLLGLTTSEPSLTLALTALIPAAIGLPLSALHLGRPIKALSAFKNIKTSWLSREGLALALYAGLLSILVVLFFIDASAVIRVPLEITILLLGLYGIHSQAMIYRIFARPSWNRNVTNMKFFGVSYIGFYLIATVLLIVDASADISTLITAGLLLSVAHIFFNYEDHKQLHNSDHFKDDVSIKSFAKSRRLYDRFDFVKRNRWIMLIITALILPLLVLLVLPQSHEMALSMMFVVLAGSFYSEISDRWLFYVTTVPLSMPGGFFIGDQRH